jgi:hypothetical protein
MDPSEDPGVEPGDPRDHRRHPLRADRPPPRHGPTGTLRRGSGPLNARLIASCTGVVVFVTLAVYGALTQAWPLFFVCCVLTAIAAAYAIVEAERWYLGDDAPAR